MMPHHPDDNRSVNPRRFLIHATSGRDSDLARKVLTSAGITCEICPDAKALKRALNEGAGGVLTVEDVLVSKVLAVLANHVDQEPDWSDLPILVLTGHGADSLPMQRAIRLLRNLVLLERPVRTASLISSVRSALLARDRQYQVSEAQERLQENEQRFKSMFDNHPDGAFIRDLDGRLLSINTAQEALLGYTLEELQDLPFGHYIVPEDRERVSAHFKMAAQGEAQKFSTRKVRKNGKVIDVDLVYFPVVVDSEIVGLHGIARDVTQVNRNERHIKYLATHDALTGLCNRTMLDDRLHHALEQAKRSDGRVGILFLDLNRFKQINDSLGHEKGDHLLKTVAARLQESVRGADTVARLGGDEFVIVLEELASSEDMTAIAEAILGTVEKPILLDEHEVSVSASIGGSLFPRDAWDANSLLKFADMAMYRAKEFGAGAFYFYNKRMNQHVLERLLTENALRLALQKNEFEVYYQPRVNVTSGCVVGLEALVRWHHPEKGLTLPSEFIPLAEEVGLIDQIGKWVLRTVCIQSKLWQEQGLSTPRVAVNISAYQLSAPSLRDRIRKILADTQVEPSCLELEITETSLMRNLDLSCELLGDLRQQGIMIAMDDFGTGYSSLAHIKRLPVDTLKIDKSFIAGVAEDESDAAIVSATIALAHHLGLKVIAEGVTSLEQVSFLKQRKCFEMQGYLFGHPAPAIETTAVMKRAESLTSSISP